MRCITLLRTWALLVADPDELQQPLPLGVPLLVVKKCRERTGKQASQSGSLSCTLSICMPSGSLQSVAAKAMWLTQALTGF